MNQLNSIKLILFLAAIIFIAKPFMGFSVYEQLRDKDETNLLVKIFAKRKPEFLDEAAARSIILRQLLRCNARAFDLTTNAFLLTLLSFLTRQSKLALNLSNSFSKAFLRHATPIYLLNRNLTI